MPEEEAWLSEEDASMTSMRRKPAKQRGRASTTTTAQKQKNQSNQAAASVAEEEPGQKVKGKKVSTKSKPKQQQLAATTGQLADFPAAGHDKVLRPGVHCLLDRAPADDLPQVESLGVDVEGAQALHSLALLKNVSDARAERRFCVMEVFGTSLSLHASESSAL